MLRPQIKSVHSGTTRSPLIRPTDDDHPLLQDVRSHSLLYTPGASTSSSQLDLSDARESSSAITTAHAIHGASNGSPTISRASKYIDETEVYVHEVTRDDTLPRIILQYQVPVQILRRANKLWANDSIQSKDTLLLPVSACGIRPELIEDLPVSLVTMKDTTTSTGMASSKSALSPRDHSPARRSPSPLSPSRRKERKGNLQYGVKRQVLINGVGLVDVTCVPSSSLSYFPPSTNPPTLVLTRENGVETRYRDSSESGRPEKRGSSFEILRAGAGQMAADAFNGTQGLIRRLKDKKNANEIDLIEL